MIRLSKKIVCIITTVSIVSTSLSVFGPSKAVYAGDAVNDNNISISEDSNVSLSGSTGNVNEYGLSDQVKDGCILHAWNWKFDTIKSKMKEIADAGFTAVQTSPIQPNKDAGSFSDSGHWWEFYQPTDFKVGNDLGSKEQFKAMCDEAHKYGIKVVVDVVANHLANTTGKGQVNKPNERSNQIPENLRNNDSFWHINDLTGTDDKNRYSLTNGPIGMPDLNTGNPELQKYIYAFLNDAQDAGADGFRFDAAKHIELPEDGDFGSQFWPNLVSATKGKNQNVFLYGEILNTPGPISIDNYTKRIRVTNNKYGPVLRGAVTSKNASGLANMSSNEFGNDAKTWVTWVESHDTFAGEYGEHTSGFSEDDIKFCWYALAARADAVPLYFARPSVFQGSNDRGAGFAGSPLGQDNGTWKDKGVAEVNKFHNYFAGTGEKPLSLGNNKVFGVERGGNGTSQFEGIVLVNLDRGATEINESCELKDGTYTDQMTGGTFTVAGGKISGKIGDKGVAVVYNAKPSTAATVSASVPSGSFKEDGIKVTLHTSNTSKSTYTINGKDEKTFKDGDTITIGEGADPGDTFTLKLNGTANEGDDASETYTYTKKDPNAVICAYLKMPSGWSGEPTAYVYDLTTDKSDDEWPGKAMTKVSDGLYSIEVPEKYSEPAVIFKCGDNRYPADQEKGLPIKDCSMVYDGNEWKEYSDPTPVKKLSVSLTSDSTDVNVGDSVNLSAKAAGGSGDYTYTFKTDDGTELYSGSKSSYTWKPEDAGTYNVTVTVNDGDKTVTSKEVEVTVKKKEIISDNLSVTLSSSDEEIDLNNEVTLKAEAAGGTGKYKYTFTTSDGEELYSGSESSYAWTPEKEGTYKVKVSVNDGENTEVSKEITVKVNKKASEELSVTLSNSGSLTQKVNSKITLTANASGGTGDYTYTFKINDRKINRDSNSSYSWTPTAAGTYKVSVIVNDGENEITCNEKTFTITDSNSEEQVNDLKINSLNVENKDKYYAGNSIEISADAEGGTGSLQYEFYVKKDGIKEVIRDYSSKNYADFDIAESGTYDIYVNVKDEDGKIVTSQCKTIKVLDKNNNDDSDPKPEGDSANILLLLLGMVSLPAIKLRKKINL